MPAIPGAGRSTRRGYLLLVRPRSSAMKRRVSILALVWLPVLIAAATLASAQDSHTQQSAEPPKQVYCPVTTDEKIDLEVFTDYKGQRVYFCCNRCKAKFTRNPEQYAAQLVSALAGQAPQAGGVEHQLGQAQGHEDAPKSQPAAEEQKDADHHQDVAATAPPGKEQGRKEHGPSTGPRWQKWLGGFHPPMVNFPIGVLVAGALAELLFIVRRREAFDHAARFCVAFAALTGIPAGVLGWFFAGFQLTDTDPLLAIHRWLGTCTVLWLFVLLCVSGRAHRQAGAPRKLYRVLLFGGTALVLATGFFGGAMVYGLDHFLFR